ncbi:MAG TPA: sorbosone dehydrogenase family protein [Terriglobia bacterium]
MKRSRILILLCLGVASLSAVIAAQQNVPPVPPVMAAKPNPGSVVPRPDNAMPKVPAAFTVELFADNVPNARMMVYAPNGDLFVSEPSQNAVVILRSSTKNGLPDQRFTFEQGTPPQRGRGGQGRGAAPAASNGEMTQPFGLAFHEGYLYVGNTNSLVRYKYKTGDTKASGPPEKLADLSGFGNHSTRNVLFSRDGKKLYVSVGSLNNIDEQGTGNEHRAMIQEYNPDGTGFRVFASGLRNPVGLALQPGTNTVWTAVNERDNLGDDTPPEYTTSVKDGGFYGWPYSYIGGHVDSRVPQKEPDLVKRAIVPDVLIPAHSAPLGIAFYTGSQFPQHYRNGLFVALHGSWNRSTTNGAKVIFIPFQNGKPGAVEDFLTGFVVDPQKNDKWGRPVGVTVTPDGSVLVSDDGGNRIWRIRYKG